MSKISIRNAPNAKSGLRDLVEFARGQIGDLRDCTLVEIGSYVGDSTEIFAEAFGAVYAVDPWQNGYDDSDSASFQHPMRAIEAQFDELRERLPNIRKVKMSSKEAFSVLDVEKVDMVYIDGLHTYDGASDDIRRWSPRVRVGGIIAGHDFQPRFSGVQKAVVEAFGSDIERFGDTSWAHVKANI